MRRHAQIGTSRIDRAQREAFNFTEAFAISAADVGLPIFTAFLVDGLG